MSKKSHNKIAWLHVVNKNLLDQLLSIKIFTNGYPYHLSLPMNALKLNKSEKGKLLMIISLTSLSLSLDGIIDPIKNYSHCLDIHYLTYIQNRRVSSHEHLKPRAFGVWDSQIMSDITWNKKKIGYHYLVSLWDRRGLNIWKSIVLGFGSHSLLYHAIHSCLVPNISFSGWIGI